MVCDPKNLAERQVKQQLKQVLLGWLKGAASQKLRIVIDWFSLTGFLKMDAQAQGCSASDQAHNDASSLGRK